MDSTPLPNGRRYPNVFKPILGTILLSVVSSSLALLDVSVYWQDIIRGSILLSAVTIDHYLNKRRG